MTPDLARIYDEYHAKVVACATKLAGRTEADDIAHDVFVKIERALGALEDGSKLSSWIYTITVNTARDFLRGQRSRVDVPLGVSTTAATTDHDGSPDFEMRDVKGRTPEEIAMRNEMISCYLDYVDALPKAYRDVYVLCELGDLTPADVAEQLGTSIGAVKIRLHRGRTRLYESLRCNCRIYVNKHGELMAEPLSD